MSAPGEQWRRADCIVDETEDHRSYRVRHAPSGTVILVARRRVEGELKESIDHVPSTPSLDERRRAIAVRFAWEEATGERA